MVELQTLLVYFIVSPINGASDVGEQAVVDIQLHGIRAIGARKVGSTADVNQL